MTTPANDLTVLLGKNTAELHLWCAQNEMSFRVWRGLLATTVVANRVNVVLDDNGRVTQVLGIG